MKVIVRKKRNYLIYRWIWWSFYSYDQKKKKENTNNDYDEKENHYFNSHSIGLIEEKKEYFLPKTLLSSDFIILLDEEMAQILQTCNDSFRQLLDLYQNASSPKTALDLLNITRKNNMDLNIDNVD